MTAETQPVPGIPDRVAPDIMRVLAPNPSPMTLHGTNSYLVGTDTLAVIDPGPDDPVHLAALLDAAGGRSISHIFVTHSHLDHSPLAGPLSRETGAPVLAFGGSGAGRSDIMASLARDGVTGGGEGIDPDFAPDHVLADGDAIAGDGWTLEVLHTPGHMGNHICLRHGNIFFSGDHVMGWASSLVSPPDGDLTDFMRSLDHLEAMKPARLLPGHGSAVDAPLARIRDLRAHRLDREAQILDAIGGGAHRLTTLVQRVYRDVPEVMHPMAARNLFAHLVDLVGRGRVVASPRLALDARFSVAVA